MEKDVRNFEEYLKEYWISVSPGSVVVPGEWYKDSVNSKNYRPVNTNLPQVVDPMFEEDEIKSILNSMGEDEDLVERIKKSSDHLEIIEVVKNYILSKRKN